MVIFKDATKLDFLKRVFGGSAADLSIKNDLAIHQSN